MKKIVFTVSNSFPAIGGTERKMYILYNALKKELNIDVLYSAKAKLFEDFKKSQANIKDYVVPKFLDIYGIYLVYKLYKGKYDVVFSQGPPSLDFYASLYCFIFRKKLIIVRPSFKNYTSVLNKMVRIFFDYLIFSISDSIIVESQEIAKHKNFLKFQTKIRIIYNGSDIISTNSSQLSINDNIRIVMIAQFTDDKDQEGLIKIFLELSKEFFNIELVLVGNGYKLNYLKQRFSSQKYIKFIEHLEYEQLVNLLIDSDIFVLKSFREGMPMTIVEAMHSGLPIVAHNVGSIPEIVHMANNGFISSTDNEMKEQIKILLKSKDLRKQFSINSLNFARKQLSVHRMISEYKKILGV